MLEAANPAVADENRKLTLTFDQPLHPQHVPGIEYFTLSPTVLRGRHRRHRARHGGGTAHWAGRWSPATAPPTRDKKVTVSYAKPGIANAAVRLQPHLEHEGGRISPRWWRWRYAGGADVREP